jgi:hypothetical protein
MSPNFLGRRGWSKTSVKPGDKITVSVRPLKEGKPAGCLSARRLGSRADAGRAPTDER